MKMYSSYALLLVVLLVQIFSSYADNVKCPFNKKCTCYVTTTFSPLIFGAVQCDSKDGKLPQFDPAPEGKYYITGDFFINNADLRVIPAKHFAAFKYIGHVSLNHKSDSPLESAEINWDDGAFDGVTMISMSTDKLDGLVPVPVALKNSGLRYMYINHGRTPISVKDNSFQNSPNLELLWVDNTIIREIQPNAFAGLEDTLQRIALFNADIRGVDSLKDALKNMKQLRILDLAYNSITEVKSDSFPDITLHYLSLTGNPIEKIDNKSFSAFKELRQVYLDYVQALTSADLATFTGLQTDTFTATFNFDKSLKSVVVSDTDDFAKYTTFDIGSTSVETIDPAVAELLAKYPGMFIYLDENEHLKCEGLEWMSKIECPARMLIDYSKCANKESQDLVDYLKSVDPESKCKKSPNLPRLLQIPGNLEQERQHSI